MFTRFDPEITKSVAVNAIDNNFVHMALLAEVSPFVIGATKVVWEVYSLTHEEELQEYHDKAVDQVSDWTGLSHDTSEKIVDFGMMVGSTARAIKQGVKKVGANLVISKAKSGIKNAVTPPVKTQPAKTSVNPPAKTPVKNAASANPAPKLVEKKTPPAKTPPAKPSSMNPPVNPNVVEKKTPSFMKPNGTSSARSAEKKSLGGIIPEKKPLEAKPLNPQPQSSQNPESSKIGKQEVVPSARGKSAPLDKEGKWPIKEGKEWRENIVGKAQKTGTEGHAFRSYREGIKAAKNPNTETVYLNRGYNKALHPLNNQKVTPNRRPDVTVVTKEGKVNVIEVPSKTDFDVDLRIRNHEIMDKLPERMQGEVDIKHIKKGK